MCKKTYFSDYSEHYPYEFLTADSTRKNGSSEASPNIKESTNARENDVEISSDKDESGDFVEEFTSDSER